MLPRNKILTHAILKEYKKYKKWGEKSVNAYKALTRSQISRRRASVEMTKQTRTHSPGSTRNGLHGMTKKHR